MVEVSSGAAVLAEAAVSGGAAGCALSEPPAQPAETSPAIAVTQKNECHLFISVLPLAFYEISMALLSILGIQCGLLAGLGIGHQHAPGSVVKSGLAGLVFCLVSCAGLRDVLCFWS